MFIVCVYDFRSEVLVKQLYKFDENHVLGWTVVIVCIPSFLFSLFLEK